jgi:hypothetical protein
LREAQDAQQMLPLRFWGRDDKGRGVAEVGVLEGWGRRRRKNLREPQGALQIPPLRCAPVGMTRGEG